MKKANIDGLTQKSSNGKQDKKNPSISIGRECSGHVLIKELNDNDVLQGRGSGSMQNTGNIRFRLLVEELRPAYVATSSRKEKAKMISDMVQLIQSRKGRFLQRLCDEEVEKLGSDPHSGEGHRDQDHYVEMTDDEAAEKAKQAIRYVHYKKVPLEEERRKKRAADNNFLTHPSTTSNDKTINEASHRIDYGGNSITTTPCPSNMTNDLTQSQVPQSNVRVGAIIPPLQQSDFNQLLATLQTTQTAITTQTPENTYIAPQAPVHQTSIHLDSMQQASTMQKITGSIIPMVGNVQHQPNTLQQLASSLFQNANGPFPPQIGQAPSPLLNTTRNQNANQQQLPQQQAQLNILLQSLIQQQTGTQQNSILQTILQQQQQDQQQQQLNSALQTLQQQQQLASTIQSLQPQQIGSDPQFQQHLQQQKTNSILATLLSNTNTNSQPGSTLGSLTTQPAPNTNSTVTDKSKPSMEATNALLTSFLSNNVTQTPAFQQSASSFAQAKSGLFLGGLLPPVNTSSANAIVSTAGQQRQQNQELLGGSTLNAIPGLAQNVNAVLAGNANTNSHCNTQGQTFITPADTNTAKRPRLSLDSVAENQV